MARSRYNTYTTVRPRFGSGYTVQVPTRAYRRPLSRSAINRLNASGGGGFKNGRLTTMSRTAYNVSKARAYLSGMNISGVRTIKATSASRTQQRVHRAASLMNRGVQRYGFQAAVGISAGTAAFAGYKAIQRRRGRRRSVAHRYSNRPLSSSQRSAIARRTASRRRRVRGRFA